MKITICASISATYRVKELSDALLSMGHKTEIPLYSQKILNGEMSIDNFLKIKEKEGDANLRKKSGEDLIKRYYELIKNSDAILVVNIDKGDKKNYIGGNTFLEMGFAYVLNKKIFLFNDIPECYYKDEVIAMKPVILNGDIDKIKEYL